MLKKITNITNVGRFKSFSWRNDNLSFKKNTFIYGKNTKGKSTLVSILKSLANQNPDLVIWRKTFWTTTDQHVTLEIYWWNILFQNNAWNNQCNIKIFDNQYVYENIYSDEIIDPSKQEKIANIILWPEWNRLEQEYQVAKRLCEENSQTKSTLTREYWKILWNTIFDFEGFRWLEIDPTLDHQIKQIQDQLDSYRNQVSIKQTIESFLPTISIDINKTILEQTLEISSEAIQNHIKENMSWKKWDEVLKFLEIWTESLLTWDNINCSYCGQPIDNQNTKQLIEAYKTMFSEQYQELNTETKKTIEAFKWLEIWFKLWQFEKILSNFGVKIEIEKKEEINQYVTDFLWELENKKDNLNYVIDFQSLDNLKILLDEVNSQINPIMIQYSNPIDTNTKTEKEIELKRLLLIKERFNPTWMSKCDEYQRLQNTFDSTLKPAEERTFNAKVEYAQRVLSWYESSINLILEKLRADFRLCEFQVPENRREELKLFGIKFWDHRIELNWEENNCYFKNSLSDSDKRLLSFAFFIADIQKTENLDNYIIVFDDPMSSLDIDRKKMTIETIRDCLINEQGQTPSQAIILTHEDSFFNMIYNTYRTNTESVFFKIDYNNLNNSSEIQTCDVEEDFVKTKHFKDLEKFKKYIDWEISWCSLSDLRIWLEYIIKSKYYLDIPRATLQNWWVVTWYKDNKCDWNTIKIQKINDIYPHQTHHDQTWQWLSEENLEDNEIKDIVWKYLDLIHDI